MSPSGEEPRISPGRAAVTVVAGMAVAGVLVGALWVWLAPGIHGVVALTDDGDRVQAYLGNESEHLFTAAAMAAIPAVVPAAMAAFGSASGSTGIDASIGCSLRMAMSASRCEALPSALLPRLPQAGGPARAGQDRDGMRNLRRAIRRQLPNWREVCQEVILEELILNLRSIMISLEPIGAMIWMVKLCFGIVGHQQFIQIIFWYSTF